jgi:2-polyprenyl-3-methyl-5-hydroxy-6-metoxy-1,4-benzoquinol methylase
MEMEKTYEIKDGYIHRTEYNHFDDTPNESGYQDQIYDYALQLMEENNLSTILDIGAGSGYKLVNKFTNYKSTGTEIEPTLSWLKDKYPSNTWILSDFANPPKEPFDIFVCADVIEHIVDPDDLLDYIDSIDFKIGVISTPEREAIQRYQRGITWDGPPNNLTHMREWNFDELNKYISKRFKVVGHFMSQNPVENKPLCQMIIIQKHEN